MSFSEKIGIRLRALEFNLNQLNRADQDLKKDIVVETGMEYGKEYPYNEDTLKLIRKQEEIRKSREDRLFFSIFNFTQVFYSIKDYLKKEYPEKERIIEYFFSDKEFGFKSRKDISNDLKHNPSSDLKYGLGKVAEEEIVEDSKRIVEIQFKHTWFYFENDSVEYCNILYKEFGNFMDTEIPDS